MYYLLFIYNMMSQAGGIWPAAAPDTPCTWRGPPADCGRPQVGTLYQIFSRYIFKYILSRFANTLYNWTTLTVLLDHDTPRPLQESLYQQLAPGATISMLRLPQVTLPSE